MKEDTAQRIVCAVMEQLRLHRELLVAFAKVGDATVEQLEEELFHVVRDEFNRAEGFALDERRTRDEP